MRKVLYFMVACVLFVSCSKDSSNPSAEISGDYFPVSAGSNWKFKDSATGNVSTLSVTGGQKQINGVNYYVVNTSSASGNVEGYVSKKDNYYSFLNLFGANYGSASLNFKYLNDTMPVNFTWTYSAGIVNTVPATVNGKIVARGLTISVEGKSYASVIQSQMALFYDYTQLGLGIIEVGKYDIFSAKGVGIIKVQSSLSTNPFDATSSKMKICSNLVEYSIK